MKNLLNEAVYSALYYGLHRASILLPNCRNEQEKNHLSVFIKQASNHMARIKPKESPEADPTDVEICNIELRLLIDSEQVLRDLKEKYKISTVVDLINLGDMPALHSSFDMGRMESSDADNLDYQEYDETGALRNAIFAMCSGVMGKAV